MKETSEGQELISSWRIKDIANANPQKCCTCIVRDMIVSFGQKAVSYILPWDFYLAFASFPPLLFFFGATGSDFSVTGLTTGGTGSSRLGGGCVSYNPFVGNDFEAFTLGK